MSDHETHLLLTFYVFDSVKNHGYIYSPIDRLYHMCDIYNIRKYLPSKSSVPLIVNKDLRPFMDISSDKIPIGTDMIYIPSTRTYRPRTYNDYFTYYLGHPTHNIEFDNYMNAIIPNHDHQNILRSHILNSLTRHISHDTHHSYIIINGPIEAVESLFDNFCKLDPLIKQGRPSLYCEAYVNKSVFDEVSRARIVLCKINYRTLRVAQIRNHKSHDRYTQYSGIVYQNSNTAITRDRSAPSIILNEIETYPCFTQNEILAWLFL